MGYHDTPGRIGFQAHEIEMGTIHNSDMPIRSSREWTLKGRGYEKQSLYEEMKALGLAIPCKVMTEICKNTNVVGRNQHRVDTSSNSRQPKFMMEGTALRPINAPCA